MKKSLENKLRDAFKAGKERGYFDGENNYFDAPLDEDEYIENLKKSKDLIEDKISFTYSFLRRKLDWMQFCELTGTNEWCLKEGGEIKDTEIFYVTESKAKEYGLL